MFAMREWSVPSKIEEEELLKKAQSGDLQARDDLITRNIPFVIKETKRWWHLRKVSWLEYDDFFQAAMLGMFHAIRKWNAERSKGGRFIGYAKHWIRNYIDSEIHYSQSYRVPLATMHNVKVGKTQNQNVIDAVRKFSNVVLIHINEDQHVAETCDLIEHEEDLLFLQEQIESLSEEQRHILERKFQGKTLTQIGKEIGCTGKTVRCLLDDIIEELRDKFRQSYPKESLPASRRKIRRKVRASH